MKPPRPRTAAAAAACALAVSSVLVACGSGPARTATQGAGAATEGGGGHGTAGAGGTAAPTTSTPTATPTGPVDFCAGCRLTSGCMGFANGQIDEASGLAASALHPDAYYLHNDSGDTARFFATNCAGDDLGTYDVRGAAAVDWEDMARGPCGRASCLYFADIGDNNENRNDYVIYRVVEPTALTPGPHTVPAAKLPFAYPDGSHNAETLLVHPVTGEMAVVTKVDARGTSAVYVFPQPHPPDQQVTLVKVADVAPPSGSVRFTAGAVHPQAQGVLLRTYTSLFYYALPEAKPLAEAFTQPPCEVPVMLELQGEAVTFTHTGTGYVTVSEKTGQSLHFAVCQ